LDHTELNPSINKPNKVRSPLLNPKQSEYRRQMEKSFIIYVKSYSQRSEESFFSLKR